MIVECAICAKPLVVKPFTGHQFGIVRCHGRKEVWKLHENLDAFNLSAVYCFGSSEINELGARMFNETDWPDPFRHD